MRLPQNTADQNTVEELKDITGADIDDCYQCLKCTAGCPFVNYMDYYPHQIMLYARMRMFDRIAQSKTLWICASCLACSSRCPRDLDPAQVMEGIRIMLLRERDNNELEFLNPKGMPRQAIMAYMRKTGR